MVFRGFFLLFELRISTISPVNFFALLVLRKLEAVKRKVLNFIPVP